MDVEAIKARGHEMGLRSSQRRESVSIGGVRRAWNDHVKAGDLKVDDLVAEWGLIVRMSVSGGIAYVLAGVPEGKMRAVPVDRIVRAFVKEESCST